MRYFPPLPTEDQLTTAALTRDGMHVQGWVRTPAGAVWRPEDLLWLPPSATKASDIDRAGRIVDVTLAPDEMAFVTAEIAKHDKYLDVIRAKVRAGAIKLTGFLAKMLGLPFDEDGVELRQRYGPVVALKSLQDVQQPDTEHGPVWSPKRHWVG